MKTHSEIWTVVVNKTKYVLNEEQANLLREKMVKGDKSPIMYKEFTIFPAFVEEFYLSDKVYDKSKLLSHETKQEPSLEEKLKVQKMMEEFREEFFAKHGVKQPMTSQEINSRRNQLLDQSGKN